jgi:hypothetical protein
VTWQKRRSRLARILGVAVLDEYPLSECRSGTHKGDRVVAVDGSPPGRAGPQPSCTRLTTRPRWLTSHHRRSRFSRCLL